MPSDNQSSGPVRPAGVDHSESAEGRTAGGPFNIQFPVDQAVWHEARRLVAGKSFRVEDVSICASQDPVIVIELLKIANAMYFSGGRQAISSTKTAIQRLGSDVVLQTLEDMKDRPQFTNEDVSYWFEIHRSRCKRTSIVSKMLAATLATNLGDECQAAGLLLYVGDMLAVAHFREEYAELAEEHSRSGINYKLAQDLKFDVENAGVTYLQRSGIPEMLLSAIDRESAPKSKDRAVMKPLCQAAGELVDAFDADRWDKFAPGKKIPPKSALRLLQLSDQQYLKLYERASEYLFSTRRLEEQKKLQKNEPVQTAAPQVTTTSSAPTNEALESEIMNILNGHPGLDEEDAFEETAVTQETVAKKPQASAPAQDPVSDSKDQFSLSALKSQTKTVARVQAPVKPVEPPKLRTAGGNQVVNSIADMFNDAQSSEQLLTSLLGMLVDKGPFKKTALIVVSKDRKHAIVVAARGIGNGQKVSLDDPLSPLAQCFSKVQSFGTRSNEASPFGSKAFALAPITADHDTPVALYADCGNDGSITFEARRIFRTVVEILNERLPSIPGGIPVELAT